MRSSPTHGTDCHLTAMLDEGFTKPRIFWTPVAVGGKRCPRRRGCGVVVAQEPSKLLGPVRVWSAAPASFLLSKDEIVHGRTARRAMPRAFIRLLHQSAYCLGISHYSSAVMIMYAFNRGIFLAMAARLVARRPCNIGGRRGGWGLSARRHSGRMSRLFVLSCAA